MNRHVVDVMSQGDEAIGLRVPGFDITEEDVLAIDIVALPVEGIYIIVCLSCFRTRVRVDD